MGIFDKLFGGKSKQAEADESTTEQHVDCPHAILVPRWETVKDMGHEDLATRFMCEACHEEFSPEEAAEIRETIAERMSASLEGLKLDSEETSESKSSN